MIQTEYQYECGGYSVYKLNIPLSLKNQSDYKLKKQLREHIRIEIGNQTVSMPQKVYQRPHLIVICNHKRNRRLYVLYQHMTDF